MHEKILLGHGSGGKLSSELTRNLFLKYFKNKKLSDLTDSVVLSSNEHIAYTTDSYVVDPVFFPGGDIGKLAVCGTINDLAVSGAIPKYMTAAFIIEEGFPLKDLEKIVASMAQEADSAGIEIVTGDTKIVNKGKCDKIFINTSGIGFIYQQNVNIGSGTLINKGDVIIINGEIGHHGIAVMSARESLSYTSQVKSDCACLHKLIESVTSNFQVKFMRDVTRGGLATVLCEIAEKTNLGIEIEEDMIPVDEDILSICEVFGYDPLYLANEGKVLMVVGPDDAHEVLSLLKKQPLGEKSAVIGKFVPEHNKMSVLNTTIGGRRIIEMLSGEQLPRIC